MPESNVSIAKESPWKPLADHFWKIFAIAMVAMWLLGVFRIQDSAVKVAQEARPFQHHEKISGLQPADFENTSGSNSHDSPHFFAGKKQSGTAKVFLKDKSVIDGYYQDCGFNSLILSTQHPGEKKNAVIIIPLDHIASVTFSLDK